MLHTLAPALQYIAAFISASNTNIQLLLFGPLPHLLQHLTPTSSSYDCCESTSCSLNTPKLIGSCTHLEHQADPAKENHHHLKVLQVRTQANGLKETHVNLGQPMLLAWLYQPDACHPVRKLPDGRSCNRFCHTSHCCLCCRAPPSCRACTLC